MCSDQRESNADALRFEVKLPLYNRRRDEILGAIMRHPLAFREAYPPRWINNLYVDTPGLDLFHQSLSGVSQRFKLRLRWYGEREQVVEEPMLQWKWRDNALGFKETQLIESALNLGDIDWRNMHPAIAKQLTPTQLHRFRGLSWPTVLNRYRRHYYYSRWSGVRLTLDNRMAFAALPGVARRSRRGWIRYHRLHVLEVKAPQACRAGLEHALDGFAYRPARYSKYASALRYLSGSVD